MKALKTILILLVVLVVLAVIAMLILPKTMDITRSQTVDAPVDQAWEHVKSLKAQDAWSPWSEFDPNMEKSFDGEEGAVGSTSEWHGNEKVGKGKQTITAVDAENHSISSLLEFFEPWESKADITISVDEADEGKSTVSWKFHQELGMPSNLIMALMSMKGALSKDFDRGLGYLKEQVSEKAAAPAKVEYQINSEERASSKYLVKKETIKIADMKAYFESSMPAAYSAAAQAGLVDTMRPPAALYWTWDEENKQAELSTAIPVNDGDAPEGYEVYSTTEGPCFVIDYYGAYDNMEAAHRALNAHLESNNSDINGAVMEEYVTDPGTEPDPEKWLTRIVYPVKAKEAASQEE